MEGLNDGVVWSINFYRGLLPVWFVRTCIQLFVCADLLFFQEVMSIINFKGE